MPGKESYAVIEKDEDGFYVGDVPQFKACYTQGGTLDELMVNTKEVIELCLEDPETDEVTRFVGIHKVEV